MHETLRLLRGLQDIDGDLFRVRDELRRLPEELNKRRSQIDSEKARLNELDAQLHAAKTRVKEIEDMTTMQRQRIKKLEGEAASSRADTALLVAFQHEIRTVRRDISEAEEEGLGLIEELEEVETRRDELASAIENAETDLEELSGNVTKEMGVAEKRRAELDASRQDRMGPIDPDILKKYEKLIDAREGQALAELEGRICQGCYVNVPSSLYVRLARGLELVECPSCGRILYLPDSD